MLNIITYDMKSGDKDVINMIFSHLPIADGCISFHDLKHEDLNIENMNAIFAIGKVSIRMVARSLIKAGKIGQSTFVGNDIYNKKSKFLFMNASVSISEIMTSQENKEFIWDKVKTVVEYYNDIFLDIEDSDGLKVKDQEDIKVKDIEDIGTSKYNSAEMLNLLFDKINLSDPGLMKSLSKYDKFILNTSSGDLVVYPTNRIPDKEEEFFITLKDLIVLLKFSDILDVETIMLSRGDGAINK